MQSDQSLCCSKYQNTKPYFAQHCSCTCENILKLSKVLFGLFSFCLSGTLPYEWMGTILPWGNDTVFLFVSLPNWGLYLMKSICTLSRESGLPLIIHLEIPWLFPDFFPDFLQFSITSDRSKNIFIFHFNGAQIITSNLGATLGSKFFPLRVAPNEEGDGLRLSHEKVHPFPFLTE